MSSFGPIHTALTQLRVRNKAFLGTAANVANLRTEGYRAQPSTPGSAEGVDLVQEAVNAKNIRTDQKIASAFVRRANYMLGALLDIVA